MRNIKDINKILAKAHFKCIFLNDAKKQHIFVETCLYEAVGSLCHVFTSHSCSLMEKSSLPIFSSPCQRQCELWPLLVVRHLLTFHILFFSSAK